MFFYFLFVPLILALDIYTKHLAATVFKLNEMEIIKDVLYFTYVENRGAAFGIMQNKQWFFVIVTVILIAAIIIYMLNAKSANKLLNISLVFIISGGIGNLIDRVFLGYVVDFIDFRIINYPVFNVADCFVVVGAILLCIILIFSKDGKE